MLCVRLCQKHQGAGLQGLALAVSVSTQASKVVMAVGCTREEKRRTLESILVLNKEDRAGGPRFHIRTPAPEHTRKGKIALLQPLVQ